MAESIIIRGLDDNIGAFSKLSTEGRKRAGKRTLEMLFANVKVQVLLNWGNIKARGGMFRGMWWAAMKPQYTRKDGTVVPAWGGVPRVAAGAKHVGTRIKWTDKGKPSKGRKIMGKMARVSGNVLGKQRPSGQRVAETSVMMQDTGNLKRTWTEPAKPITDDTLHLGHGNRPGLSKGFVDEQNRRREFLFWTTKDHMLLRKLHRKYLNEEIERLFK